MMAVVKRWCRSLIAAHPFVSVVLVHHLRKSASGATGLEMSGSGAMYGAVDSTVIWKARKEAMPSDDEDTETLVFVGEMYGSYRVETRGDAPFSGRWRFDADGGLIVAGVGRQVTASGRAVPGTAKAGVLDVLRGAGTHGISSKSLAEMVGVAEGNVRMQLKRLLDKGVAVKEGGLWFADGLAPHQGADVILPVQPGVEEPVWTTLWTCRRHDEPTGEEWVDPLHRLS